MGNFYYKRKVLPNLILFTVGKDLWSTKEDTSKSIKNAFTRVYCSVLKGTFRAAAMLNSEKIKSIALAIIKLCSSKESVNQSVSQSVSH